MAKCLRWIDSCRELGWAEDQLDDLEDLFWKYRDSDGEKRPNDSTTTELSRADDLQKQSDGHSDMQMP
jgi:hypothetical protein